MSGCSFSVLTVTYGDRYDLLLEGPYKTALENGLNLLVVCNGVSESYLQKLCKLEAEHRITIKLIVHEANQGSAGGFYSAIDNAKVFNTDYYLLLDDDNYLEYKLDNDFHYKDASFFPRDGRSYINAAIKGETPDNYLAKPNSFLGFSIERALRKAFPKSKGSFALDSFSFPWAPYGGLMLSQKVLNSGIMPNKELFLYCDDTDYTYRISNMFGLYLNTKNRVLDVGDSWNVSAAGNVITRLQNGEDRWRVYYSVRNQVFFDKSVARNCLSFSLNTFVFCFLFLIFYLFKVNKSKNGMIVAKAILDGFRNRLGNNGFDL